MALKNTRAPAAATLRQRLSHVTEPYILYPAIVVLVLAAIWATTLNLILNERAAAVRTAAGSSHQLADIYEAQVVGALREIDEVLKVVKYAFEIRGSTDVLRELKTRGLLPPDLLFVVTMTDSNGKVVASTRASELSDLADQDYFQSQREADVLSVGRPRRATNSEEWTLRFSRRLNAANGRFSGIVVVAVDAAFFVSGYELDELGERGVLGILGTDGVFLARRSGETLMAGDKVDYAAVVSVTEESSETAISTSSWDGVLRYTTARQLYDFPVAVIVGLSVDEQLAGVRSSTYLYLLRASGGSLLLILGVAALGRLSRQLARERLRAVDEQIAHAKRVEYLAYHDGLTTLPNRSLFNKILTKSILQARRRDRQLAVLFMDLDRFKNINDTLGHRAGDQLLQEVAIRLKTCLRENDSVARLGGDEFVVLITELADGAYAIRAAQQILVAIAQPFDLLGHEFRVTASIGISMYPKDGLDEQTLKKNADIAMYKAKEEGKNNFQFYSEKLSADSLERLALESGLRHALERGEFQLHYQPKIEIHSNRITGFEALLRWLHPDLGIVAPLRFIPVAEETGLIVPIGTWVLRAACEQNVALQALGLPYLSMAVNLTARQFNDEHLLANVAAILADTGMDSSLLELEIHESLLMRDIEKALRILTALKDMGIRIAIDDFGSGYVTLATLQQFPVDTIKIDRSFIRDVACEAKDKNLTAAIIAMGRTLSLTVVAVGVETKEQVEFLRENVCHQIQGFYFNKPMPGNQIAELLRTQTRNAGRDAPAAV